VTASATPSAQPRREVSTLLGSTLAPINTAPGRLSREERKLQQLMQRFEALDKGVSGGGSVGTVSAQSVTLITQPAPKKRRTKKKRAPAADAVDADAVVDAAPVKSRKALAKATVAATKDDDENEDEGNESSVKKVKRSRKNKASTAVVAATAAAAAVEDDNKDHEGVVAESAPTPSKGRKRASAAADDKPKKKSAAAAAAAAADVDADNATFLSPLDKKKAWYVVGARYCFWTSLPHTG
jgi:hypothetical protein